MPVSRLATPNPLPRYSFQTPSVLLASEENPAGKETAGPFSSVRIPILPYTMQDEYDRLRRPGVMETICLENEHLRAVFYPDYGGRMASLFDKDNGRELLFDNPVFQPANLALRNAWFSGGIEWNYPVFGHSMQTCSPVFAGVVKTSRGDILRIYEFDRLFETVWQVDIWLPDAARELWVHVTLRNPNPRNLDIYWWTNIAVPLGEKTRVLSPAAYAIRHRGQSLEKVAYPFLAGFDASYPYNYSDTASVFVRPERPLARPWQAYVDGNGYGLAHLSTPTLYGRKIFVWGNSPGGRHWMDFLALPGKGDYVELQGGITATQVHTRPLAANSHLSWTECYLPLTMPAEDAHGCDFKQALNNIQRVHEVTIPAGHFAQTDAFLHSHVNTRVAELLHHGTVWGQLHEKIKGKHLADGLDFGCPVRAEEQPWRELIQAGTFTEASLACHPLSWSVSDTWMEVVHSSMFRCGATWLHHLHLGVAALEKEDFAAAQAHFNSSRALKDSFEAQRNLALICDHEGDVEAALAHYRRAYALSNGHRHLAVEIVLFMKAHGFEREMHEFAGELPEHVRSHERIQLALAESALAGGRFAEVRRILNREFSTIREGELSLSELWFALHIKEAEACAGHPLTAAEIAAVKRENPPPPAIDFRMTKEC